MADPELSHLRQTIAVATSSWQEAEVARQVAQRESIAVKQALHQLETQPHVASGDATADEEQRLRKQLEAIQAERERKAQVDKLQEEAARSARSVAAAEIEAKMRHLHLEKVEAQQQAAAARAEAQEAMQGAQRHGGSKPDFEASASEFGRIGSVGRSAPPTVLVTNANVGPVPAETDTLMSMLDLHTQLQTSRTQTRSQARIVSSLQDKLRKVEESLKETQAAEQRARADCTRHATKRKEEEGVHASALKKHEKRTEAAEQKVSQLQAANNAQKDEIASLRQAILETERRAVAAEDRSGPASKTEMNRMRDEKNEALRKLHETERLHTRLLAARDKEHAAAIRETQAKHDSRKVSLRYAQRMKDQATDKLFHERRRADVAEQEAVLSHWEVQKLAAEKTAKALAPRHSGPGGNYGQETRKATSAAAVAAEAAAAEAAAAPFARSAGSGADWYDMSSNRSNVSPSRRSVTPSSCGSARLAPRSPTRSPTRVEMELDRATQRSIDMLPHGRPSYLSGTDTRAMYEDGSETGLFDRTSTSPRASIPQEVGILKDKLAGSLAKMGDVFRMWDRNGSGRIERVEFRLAVKSLGIDASDQVCDTVFREFDANGSGAVDYREYVIAMLRDALHRFSWRVLDIFAKMDKNNDGTISRAEFRRGLQEFGFDASPTDLDAIFDDIDLDGSGRVEYGELHARLRQGQKISSISSASGGQQQSVPRDRSLGTMPSGRPISSLVPPSQFTSADPFNSSSTQSRDRRRGHAVANHLERMTGPRGERTRPL